MQERPFNVLLTDLDGVVFWRIPAQKAAVPLIGNNHPENYRKPVRIMPFNGLVDDMLTPATVFQAVRHLIVPVFPDVRRVLSQLYESGVMIYGNSGRHNDCAMVQATFVSLALNGTSENFRGIFFRPRGLSTTESKVAGLKYLVGEFSEEEKIVVADDNPADLLPMAKLFPRVRFFLIRDFTTKRLLAGINLEEEFPNVKVKPTLRTALIG